MVKQIEKELLQITVNITEVHKMTQNMYIDERFVICYQNMRTCREHRAIVAKDNLDETVEWYKRRGNLVSYVPYTATMDEWYL